MKLYYPLHLVNIVLKKNLLRSQALVEYAFFFSIIIITKYYNFYMTKQEREEQSEKKYQAYIVSRDKFLIELKHKVKWSIAYLIYFPIFLILFATVLILIFTLGKLGFYFIPFAGLLFTSWFAIYLIFVITCNYISSNSPALYVLTAIIPIGGFIIGIVMPIHILRWYKEFLRDNTDEKLWKAAFSWKFK